MQNKCKSKLIMVLFMVFLVSLIGTACGKPSKPVVEAKPVNVMEAEQSVYQNEIVYFGAIEPEKLKKYSFQNGGKIENMVAFLGMEVKNGTLLATLDSENYGISQAAAKATYESAKSAVSYAENNFENMKKLYDEGAISKDDLDRSLQAKNGAVSNFASAAAAYDNANITVENTILKADIDGIVADVLFESGEMVGAGTPVVVVSSKEQKAVIGVAIDDVNKIKEGEAVTVSSDEKELAGSIKNIGKLPDMATRTYPVEITMRGGTFTVGSFVNVKIPSSTGTGILLPITALMDHNGSYVYTVGHRGKVEKKSVEVQEIKKTSVVVTGISVGEKVIVSGMKTLESGDLVKIVN